MERRGSLASGVVGRFLRRRTEDAVSEQAENQGARRGDHEGSVAPAGAETICSTCDGSGKADGESCSACGGSGKVVEPVGGA